ncbi:MAG: hypothetical protein ACE5J7_02195 [Candidatus Aenigmatarchaeota archaeon]
MPVYESSHKSHFEVARRNVPSVMLGFHFENMNIVNIPIPDYKEEIAELIAAVSAYNDPRYILSRAGDLSVFDNDCGRGGPSLTTLSQNGDIHFFEKFFYRKETSGQPTDEEIMEIFEDAKKITSALAWPLKPYGGANYMLHRSEIEIYLMGGTKKLPKQQKGWRKAFRKFGKEVYTSAFRRKYDIEVIEENVMPRFRFKKNSGAYHSGYLKSVVRARIPDLVIKKLP